MKRPCGRSLICSLGWRPYGSEAYSLDIVGRACIDPRGAEVGLTCAEFHCCWCWRSSQVVHCQGSAWPRSGAPYFSPTRRIGRAGITGYLALRPSGLLLGSPWSGARGLVVPAVWALVVPVVWVPASGVPVVWVPDLEAPVVGVAGLGVPVLWVPDLEVAVVPGLVEEPTLLV